MKRKIRQRLAAIRGNRSQNQFAHDLDVFQQNVNRYEAGKWLSDWSAHCYGIVPLTQGSYVRTLRGCRSVSNSVNGIVR